MAIQHENELALHGTNENCEHSTLTAVCCYTQLNCTLPYFLHLLHCTALLPSSLHSAPLLGSIQLRRALQCPTHPCSAPLQSTPIHSAALHSMLCYFALPYSTLLLRACFTFPFPLSLSSVNSFTSVTGTRFSPFCIGSHDLVVRICQPQSPSRNWLPIVEAQCCLST